MKSTKNVNICGEPLRPPIDPKNDGMMVRENLRLRPLVLNREIFKKTDSEKRLLKNIKYKKKFPNSTPHSSSSKQRHVYKATVYLINKKKDKNFKTTHSFYCYDKHNKNEVKDMLKIFNIKDEDIKKIKID